MIVPALNEEENIEEAVLLIREALANCPSISAFELIVVNDGSNDRTGSIAKQLSQYHNEIIYLENRKNRSIGYCYKKGLPYCHYDYVTWLAADGSYLKEELINYFNAFCQGTVPISYSYTKEALQTRSFFRRLLSESYRRFIFSLFGVRGINYINGVALYERRFLECIPIVSNGFSITTELLLRAWHKGYILQNVKMNSVERKKGKSKAFKLKNIVDFLRVYIILFYEFHIQRHNPIPSSHASLS